MMPTMEQDQCHNSVIDIKSILRSIVVPAHICKIFCYYITPHLKLLFSVLFMVAATVHFQTLKKCSKQFINVIVVLACIGT